MPKIRRHTVDVYSQKISKLLLFVGSDRTVLGPDPAVAGHGVVKKVVGPIRTGTAKPATGFSLLQNCPEPNALWNVPEYLGKIAFP